MARPGLKRGRIAAQWTSLAGVCVAVALCVCTCTWAAAEAVEPGAALATRASTGAPRQTGFNAVGLWWLYQAGNATGARASMQQAAAAGFPYLRVAATGFWPTDMASYMQDAATYWDLFDTFVADAASAGVRLVLDIQWNMFLFSDLAKEPLGQLFQDGSASRAMFFNYTHTMVSRYATTDTVFMWEVGNEYNLLADLNLTQQQPSICVKCGTPPRRTRADNFSTPMLVQLQHDITAVIRAADTLQRPISSGCSVPRPQAWHLMQSYHQPRRDWTADSRAQFQQMLLMVNDAFDVVNVHYYNSSMLRWNLTSYTGVLDLVWHTASGAGKPLYVGEFGQSVPGTARGKERARPFARAVLDFVAQRCVPYSSTWVWEFPQQADTFSITPELDAVYIAAAAAANKQLAAQCPPRPLR